MTQEKKKKEKSKKKAKQAPAMTRVFYAVMP